MIKALKQIFMPNENRENSYVNYDNQLKPRIEVDTDKDSVTVETLWEIYSKNKKSLFGIVEKEITDYLSDESACNDDENMSPKWKCLTGDWYISDISIHCYKDGEIVVSIMTAFTEAFKMNDGETKIMDYLGMEVINFYNKEKNQFVFSTINTSSI